MSDSLHNPIIEPELQVRLMNLAMGEASDFESDQLQSLMEQRPELAAYLLHLQHLHGLLCEVGTIPSSSEATPESSDENWKLSAERRDKLLKFLDAKQPNPQVALSVNRSGANKPMSISSWIKVMAVLATAACLLIGLMLPAVQSAREAARRPMANVDAYYLADQLQSTPEDGEVRLQTEQLKQSQKGAANSTAPRARYSQSDAVTGIAEDVVKTEGYIAEDFDLSKAASDSKSELMAFDNIAAHDARFKRNEQDRVESKSGVELPRIEVRENQFWDQNSIFLGGIGRTPEESRYHWFDHGHDGNRPQVGQEAVDWKFATPSIRLTPEEESVLALEAKPAEVSASTGERTEPELEQLLKERVDEVGKLALGKDVLREKDALYRLESAKKSIDEQSAAVEAFSTFSLHVSDVSFKLAQAALAQGQWPEAGKIRIEEFVNAIDYHDPLPSGDEKVACRVEQAIHPFLIQRNLLRVSMRTAATGRSQATALRLTIVLDNSGSMERPDRRQAVLRAFSALIKQLRPTDQVTLISFASTPRLLVDKLTGSQWETLVRLVEGLPSEGGTNIEAALKLAREKALEHRLPGAQNRIVLLTDGAVNLGNAEPESLSKLVTQLRDEGIAFDAAGISAADLNDDVLEALTRQGDGRYYLLDSAEDAGEGFAAQIAGALRPSAQNVKVQIEFNPDRVGSYKLLGFEQHRLNKEDFRNDQVDAAE